LNRKITFENYEAFELERGLIENQIKNDVVLDEKDVRNLKEANTDLANGKPYAVLVEFEEMVNVTREARELTASKDFLGKTIAEALLIHSLGHKIIGNFYLSVSKPHIRTKIFTDRTEALEWLRAQIPSFNAGKLKLGAI
jgi:hypothetical protein